MPEIIIDDIPIHYSRNGVDNSEAIIAIHGSGGDREHWPEELRNHSDLGVYALDLPGHGLSGGSGQNRVKEYADFLENFVSALKIEKAVLMGHSLGGGIVLSLALKRFKPVTRLIIVGSGGRLRVAQSLLEGITSDFTKSIDMLCDWAHGPEASENLVSQTRQKFLQNDPQTIYGDLLACDRFDVLDQLHEIDYPTLVVSGSEDRLTPPKYGHFLEKSLPDARHVIMANCGHMMALEKPEEFARHIHTFLKS